MYAVDVGHFTHFAFTMNFTHCVKTKPDSGFTVKSRTLPIYAYFTPSQGSANRSASGGVLLLGAMARPASANPGLFPVSPHLTQLSPLINTPNVR